MSITKRNSKVFALATQNDGTTVRERAREYGEFAWDVDQAGVEKFLAKNPGGTFTIILRSAA